jgi:methylmalonyl-CoA carboxyltransferase large subunit
MTADQKLEPEIAPGAVPATDAAASAEVIADLIRRVSAMEEELAQLRSTVAANVPEHVVLAISAAVAAFLGKRATVKQIHLVGDTTWAREGRAYVQSVHSASRRR